MDRRSLTLILHERVFLSLSNDRRSLFEEFDLKAKEYVIRDDPAATKAYFCRLDQLAVDGAPVTLLKAGGRMIKR